MEGFYLASKKQESRRGGSLAKNARCVSIAGSCAAVTTLRSMSEMGLGMMTTKRLRLFSLLLLRTLLPGWIAFSCTEIAQAAPDPAVIFASRCGGCHSVGRGEVVGPDLKGVTSRHDRDWLHRFITSSQTVIRSRDKEAVALFERYRRQVMPDHPLSSAEIDALLAFVSVGGPGAGDSEIRLASAASGAEVSRGRDLFLGRKPLVNGGAACIHCHAAGAADPVAAGTLAPDLTRTYFKYKDWGLVRVLEKPQLELPLMSDLYGSRPLTHDEAYALSAFLCRAAHGKAVPIDRAAPSRTAALFGFGGSALIFWWTGRRKGR